MLFWSTALWKMSVQHIHVPLCQLGRSRFLGSDSYVAMSSCGQTSSSTESPHVFRRGHTLSCLWIGWFVFFKTIPSFLLSQVRYSFLWFHRRSVSPWLFYEGHEYLPSNAPCLRAHLLQSHLSHLPSQPRRPVQVQSLPLPLLCGSVLFDWSAGLETSERTFESTGAWFAMWLTWPIVMCSDQRSERYAERHRLLLLSITDYTESTE